MIQSTSRPDQQVVKVKQFSSPLAGYTSHIPYRRFGMVVLLR
ncbi:hypothetical protein [Aestuariibacter sp. A3R04]|nr:hypothetical protein [Aestuariibacter sp. A3R04]